MFDGLSYIYNEGSDLIERLNVDLIGTLCNFIGTTDIRMPVEYNIEYVKIIHNTVNSFCSYIANDNTIQLLLSSSYFLENTRWTNYYKSLTLKNTTVFKSQDKLSLTQLANYYNSDKGNTYKCAHHYTIKYEELIDTIVNKLNIKAPRLLEIGLNRDNSNSIPSLMIWKDYFNNNIDITGFDIEPIFSKFNGIHNNIHIYIGDQSNIMHLNQLKNKTYHIIIDDGYHASMHQQITFKTLWNNVESGGYFIIEDLHWQPRPENCMKTRSLFENWYNCNYISSEYINLDEVNEIIKTIQSIEFYSSRTKIHADPVNAMVCIKKK